MESSVWEFLSAAHGPAVGTVAFATSLAPRPGGAQIVFCGPAFERLEGKPEQRIAVLDVREQRLRTIGSAGGSQSAPAWSPDGQTLAFVSDRTSIQLSCEESSPVEIAALDEYVEGLEWHSEAQRLLVRVAGRGADASGAAGSGALTHGKHERPSWYPTVERAGDASTWRRARVLDGKSGAFLWSTPDGDNVWEATWCGPTAILAVVSDDPSESSWYSARLVLYDVKAGTRRDLYAGREEIGVPAASPDGRYAALLEACSSDRTLVAGELLLFDLQDASPSARRIAVDADVTHVVWRDASRLFFAGLRRLDCVAGEVDVRTGKVTELWSTSESFGSDFPVAHPQGDGNAFVAVLEKYGGYPRIVRVENGKVDVLWDFAHAGSEHVARNGGRLEVLRWNGRDGLEIDAYLVLPEGDGPFPLVVNVHGGPVFSFRNEWTMHYYYVPILAANGYAVLNPNPRGSRGRGQDFARQVRGEMCGEDTWDIVSGVDAAIAAGYADPKRVAVMGRSYGGYMASWLVTQTDRFAAAIPMAPVTDSFSHHFTSNIPEFDRRFLADTPYETGGKYASRSPVFFANRAKTPTLSMAGAQDRCTPASQALEFHRALVENGVPSELVIYPEEGHHIDRIEAQADQMTRILEWLERYLTPSS